MLVCPPQKSSTHAVAKIWENNLCHYRTPTPVCLDVALYADTISVAKNLASRVTKRCLEKGMLILVSSCELSGSRDVRSIRGIRDSSKSEGRLEGLTRVVCPGGASLHSGRLGPRIRLFTLPHPVGHREWRELDNLLVQLWILRSVHAGASRW